MKKDLIPDRLLYSHFEFDLCFDGKEEEQEEEGGVEGEGKGEGEVGRGKACPRVRSLSLSANPSGGGKRGRSKSKKMKKEAPSSLIMKGLGIGRGSERIGRREGGGRGEANWEIFPRRTMFFAFFSEEEAHIWTYNWSPSQVKKKRKKKEYFSQSFFLLPFPSRSPLSPNPSTTSKLFSLFEQC